MIETTESLRRKIHSAGDLQSVVRTMKALAAANISQYEDSVRALGRYYRTVELGLAACLRDAPNSTGPEKNDPPVVFAVVFGSDQGLVGQFNDVVADFAIKTLASLSVESGVWAVGERVYARLADAGVPMLGLLAVPNSVKGIIPLIGRVLVEAETRRSLDETAELRLFHNRPGVGAVYAPVTRRLLPLDEHWVSELRDLRWPTKLPPEVIGAHPQSLQAFIREFLFVSLFRSCAESLASENASRLAAMERADRNIDDLLEELHDRFNRQRQSGIDEELFDLIDGFEALKEI